jgi:hypothetical protein
MNLEDQSLATLLPKPPGHFNGHFGRAVPVIKKEEGVLVSYDLRDDVGCNSGLSEVPVIAIGSLKTDVPLKPWKQQAQPRRSQLIDSRESMRKMDAILKDNWRTNAYIKKPYVRLTPKVEPCIQISAIRAYAYQVATRHPENEVFMTNFDEIDRILKDRYAETAEAEQISAFQEATEAYVPPELRIPERYREFKDVASKEASDTLLPHRVYDYKIDLEKPNGLGYTPLYKMTTAELEETKRYLLDNLNKGFIEPSYAPFAAPILFVKKPDGSLRLCIDFRKLNELTRKDRYLLPLIDELLARLSKAKVYTKLDIRQAFHCICMDPAAEELIIFRTRYGSYKCKVLPFGLTNGPVTY